MSLEPSPSSTVTSNHIIKSNAISSSSTSASSSSPPPRIHHHSKSPSSSTTVQPDQIAVASSVSTHHSSSHHNSASYRQELMSCSVLLDDINSVLAQWESENSHSHSLQPHSTTSPSSSIALFSPIISSVATNDNVDGDHRKDALIDIKSPSKRINPRSTSSLRSSRRMKVDKSRRPPSSVPVPSSSITLNSNSGHHSYSGSNTTSGTGSTAHSLTERGVVTVAGPHQTYYVRDDVAIKNGRKQHFQKSGDSKGRSKRHRNHNGNGSRNRFNITMESIPRFVSENDRRLTLLGEMIDLKRAELERISHRHDETLSGIMNLYLSATAHIISLRKQHRTLCCFAEQLSREGQLRNKVSDSILETLHNIEEQRKKLLNKIESPSWEIKHHFHVLSFEHFRGNQQPHLLEIAQLLPSRLQIAAISHHSTLKNDALLHHFNVAQKERDLLFKKLSQIEKQRNLTQSHLKDYKKMMNIIRKNIGPKRLQKLLQQQQGLRSQNEHQSKQNKPRPISPFLSSLGVGASMPSNLNGGIGSIIGTSYSASSHNMMGGMNGAKPPFRGSGPGGFREQYLSNLNIRKSKKTGFNLNEFVVQINKFLSISGREREAEMAWLKEDDGEIMNPMTGQMVKSLNAGNENQTVGSTTNEVEDEQKERIQNGLESTSESTSRENTGSPSSESDASTTPIVASSSSLSSTVNAVGSGNGSGTESMENGMNGINTMNGMESQRVNINKPRFVMKEKKIRQNVVDIIDGDHFELKEEATDRGDWKKYSVSLRKKGDSLCNESTAKKEIETEPDPLNLDANDEKEDAVHHTLNQMNESGNGLETESGSDSVTADAPHRDWSVLAKYLKDSSKEQAKRKQILKQLERILHVREGLIVGFEQLKQHHNNFMQHKIQ